VSPIFRHGRLRLYLLKLLDEAPRHGYEVIRLLQDRFMGVYSPSPGTIYPRLARLEEDGLVTHDEIDGRKVYRITEKGREEIRARLDDLAELEEELTESVRDIAREVTEDVRDTVRSLREEITWAARDVRREGRESAGRGEAGRDDARRDDARRDDAGRGDAGRGDAGPEETGRGGPGQPDAAQRIRDEARRAREDIRDTFRSQRRGGGPGRQDPRGPDAGGQGSRGEGARGQGSRGQGSRRQDWGGWADRAAGWQAWGDRREQSERKNPGGWGGWQDWAAMPAGLERLASEFAQELNSAAGHAGDIGEGALGDLRDILSDTLARIRDEVFPGRGDSDPKTPGPAETGAAGTSTAGTSTAGTETAEGMPAEDEPAAPAPDGQDLGDDGRPTG
jgi:DNA-binding PadR family transcriptional regulator